MAKRIIKDELTAERLRELLDYNPHTGEFVWRVSCRGTKAGDIAGSSGAKVAGTSSLGTLDSRPIGLLGSTFMAFGRKGLSITSTAFHLTTE